MARTATIALDAMGADHGPEVIVLAAELALTNLPEIEFIIVGDAAHINPILMSRESVRERTRVVHTDIIIPMNAKPSQALRLGRRNSSMWLTTIERRSTHAARCS